MMDSLSPYGGGVGIALSGRGNVATLRHGV